ncbi:MAG: PQQ-binding-like beta-propeller repeat protein, partial [Halioglobus sp.]|nr:PQQ-binding-like beta-propeller repeat protein [Halioglobus sp.]
TNWGLGTDNRRFMSGERAGINRANVGGLELAWSLAFPKVTDMRSQPAIIGDTLYLGDKTGKLYAIDRHSGCIRAHTEVLSGIRSAITVVTLNNGKKLLVFADSMASIYAVDPVSLKKVWQEAARIYETSVITGSISYHDDRLFVPVSSYEVAVSGSPTHVCCKSHGGVIALDATNGNKLWEWHGTADATLQGRNRD